MNDDPFLASLTSTRPARSRDGRNGGRNGNNGGSSAGGATRVPPHNLPAEEAVLGAILLSREALGSVIEAGLRYDDFYKPAHQHIYDVAVAVSQSGGPADTITVADELQRLGLLEAVGGVETLHGLQNATPAISNAGHYAKIVADAAMLRRLIMVAGDISEIAYSGPDNVDQALDEAETRVFKVADRRVSDTYAEIGELMKGAIERIEENYARGDTITGTPTGYQDLDELLSGLQPSTLNIIGARPAMGKALCTSTPLPTPDGWTTMGDVQLGAELLDEHGQRCLVTYATPVQLGNECFEVRFDDGSVLVADAEHQWFAFDFPAWKSLRGRTYNESATRRYPQLGRDQSARWKLPRVVTTRQMLDEGVRVQGERPNWYLQLTAPLDLPDVSLPVDPYVFGCWLGDGTTAHASMTIGPEDVEHFTTEFEQAGYMLRHAGHMLYRTCPPRGAKVDSDGTDVRSLHAELRELSLLRGAEKYIPQRYLRGSFKQRLALLQGIMDTDGHGRPGQHLVELTFADRGLLEQVHELVCSLGHKAHEIHERAMPLPGGRMATAWRFTWSPLDPVFRMSRKADAVRPPDPGAHRKFTRRAVIAITPIPSVPMRCITVDSPNSLYLAGRTMIPTHNTAFGLGMASNVAKVTGKAVLVFSLEMGHIELTQRILSSEAEVDSTKIRNGKLTENDWARIGRAIGRLEVPLYLDDNPRVTVMEIRAKARRLKMQRGDLGLILIDYLQLMSGGGNSENRQLEVSEISRNLKILARELEVPIVALSQLSRNLEARSDKKPMLSDLRESGCLTASTRLLRADTNTEVTLGDLVSSGALDVPVWSLDEHYRVVPTTLTHAFPSGVKRVFRLRLASGRTVDATGNHRFRTVDGWTPLDELSVGARLAVPRALGAPEHVAAVSSSEIATLAEAEHVDPRVFALPTTQVAHYLRRRWDLARKSGAATIALGRPVSLDCRDGRVAADVQHLLLRLSIRSTMAPVGRGDDSDDGVRVRISGLDSHRRFVTDVLQSSAAIPDAASDDENDTVPGSVDGRRGESSRGRLAELADVLGDKDLADLAASDVLWDRIVGIDEIGVQEVFDATVLSTHNFIANGIVAHNSLEQDADVVMFLYRDEVYNKESPDRGAADLIVAKHRAGPIGDMRLVFRGQYARFDNAAPRAMG